MRLILTSRTQNDDAWILKIDLACALPTFSSLDDKDKRGGVVGEQQTPPILKITSLTNHCTLSSLEPDTHTYGAHCTLSSAHHYHYWSVKIACELSN